MRTDLSGQIHELMECGVRPVSLADIQRRAPARVTAPRRAAYRLGAGPGRVLTRLGWPQLAAGAAAAVAAAVTLAVTLGGSPGRTGGRDIFPALPAPPASAESPPAVVSPGPHPSSASLAKAMLTAFNAAADSVAQVTVTSFTAGHLVQLDQWWNWPAVPSPGQVEYAQDAFSQIPPGASKATGTVKLTEVDGYTTIVPRPSVYGQDEQARLTVVCYAGTGQTGCGWGRYNTPAGTWSQHTAVMPYVDYTPDPRGADLAQQIANGQWRIIGNARLRGQQAIKLAETPSGHFSGRPVYLWVSTTTYLPLQMIWGPATSYQIWNWDYLTPSKASLAHLAVPIPPGYPRSG